ncbi:MAG: M20/M25/M40 family metallo-hydrolase [Acidobacteria bacterium]|nr:MAG: M20/M25/M40 family metallo-hydrolase [Acidobacteriota bacterium]
MWRESVLPALSEFVSIPAQSPAFDPEWKANGHIDRAVEHVAAWIRSQGLEGLELEVLRMEGRTPLLFFAVNGGLDETVLFYGHLDKQPPVTGWEPGLGPWTPVVRDGKLYGRGAADDGYAVFLAIAAIRAVQEQGVRHARCVGVIECCEESGSQDLPPYLDRLRDRIGTPSLIVCPDSGCGNYDQLWVTSSLRGMAGGDLTVRVLREGVHSGEASGIVPSSFRILRALLSRLEDEATGRILPEDFQVEIPAERLEQTRRTAEVLGKAVYEDLPWEEGVQPVTEDVTELLLNRTWRPQLAVVGAAGLPPLEEAGNVLRPETTVRVSLRLPPTLDPDGALAALRRLLETDPPYGAKVSLRNPSAAPGWNAPAFEPWLARSLEEASQTYYGKPACFIGEGGSIPLMGLLQEKFPRAQFLVTGVLGPKANAHGPNEFLHLDFAERLTACVAQVLADQGAR